MWKATKVAHSLSIILIFIQRAHSLGDVNKVLTLAECTSPTNMMKEDKYQSSVATEFDFHRLQPEYRRTLYDSTFDMEYNGQPMPDNDFLRLALNKSFMPSKNDLHYVIPKFAHMMLPNGRPRRGCEWMLELRRSNMTHVHRSIWVNAVQPTFKLALPKYSIENCVLHEYLNPANKLYKNVSGPKIRMWEQDLSKVIHSALTHLGPDSVLIDGGASLGAHSLYIAARGHHVWAVDIVFELLDAMRISSILSGFEDRVHLIHNGIGHKREIGITEFTPMNSVNTRVNTASFSISAERPENTVGTRLIEVISLVELVNQVAMDANQIRSNGTAGKLEKLQIVLKIDTESTETSYLDQIKTIRDTETFSIPLVNVEMSQFDYIPLHDYMTYYFADYTAYTRVPIKMPARSFEQQFRDQSVWLHLSNFGDLFDLKKYPHISTFDMLLVDHTAMPDFMAGKKKTPLRLREVKNADVVHVTPDMRPF